MAEQTCRRIEKAMVFRWLVWLIGSGQIITTSAEVTPNGGFVRESPKNPFDSGFDIIVIYPDWFGLVGFGLVGLG